MLPLAVPHPALYAVSQNDPPLLLQIRLVLTLLPPSLCDAAIDCGSVVTDIHMTHAQYTLDLRFRVL
jgi:hypothetical protein